MIMTFDHCHSYSKVSSSYNPHHCSAVEAPSTKRQKTNKLQNSSAKLQTKMFGIWILNLKFIWNLDFGI